MQQSKESDAKIRAAMDPDDPIFTRREHAALEMASLFSERYRDFSDSDFTRWRELFSDEELVELAVFMALADGFGKVVEMLGLGRAEQADKCEV